MDSHELTGRSGGNRWIPLVAVFQDDLRQIVRHWAFWLWAGLALILPILWMFNASSVAPNALAGILRQFGGNHEVAKPTTDDALAASRLADDGAQTHVVRKTELQDGYVSTDQDYNAQKRAREIADRPYGDNENRLYTARSGAGSAPSIPGSASMLGGKLLGMHILVWIVLSVALGASAISSEFTSIGESVLCWGVSRWQYFLGKTAARSLAAMAIVVGLSLPMLLVFNTKATGDLAFWASIQTTLVCASIVGCVAAMGVATGVWFRNSMRAVGISVVALLILGVGCAFLAPPAYSPTDFVHGLPQALRGIETKDPSSLLSFSAWSAGSIGVLSLGRFIWADL